MRRCFLCISLLLLLVPSAAAQERKPLRGLDWGENLTTAIQRARKGQVPLLLFFRDDFGHDYAYKAARKASLELRNLPSTDEPARSDRRSIRAEERRRRRTRNYERREDYALKRLRRLWRWRKFEDELFRDPEVMATCRAFERVRIDLGASTSERMVALALQLKVLSREDVNRRVDALVYPPRIRKLRLRDRVWEYVDPGDKKYYSNLTPLSDDQFKPRGVVTGGTVRQIVLDARKLLADERTTIVITSDAGEILFSSARELTKPQFLQAVELALSPYRHWHQAKKLLAGKDERGALPHLAAVVEQEPKVKRLVEWAKLALAPIEKKALILLQSANEQLKAGRKAEALAQFEKLRALNYDKISAEIAKQTEEGLAQAGK